MASVTPLGVRFNVPSYIYHSLVHRASRPVWYRTGYFRPTCPCPGPLQRHCLIANPRFSLVHRLRYNHWFAISYYNSYYISYSIILSTPGVPRVAGIPFEQTTPHTSQTGRCPMASGPSFPSGYGASEPKRGQPMPPAPLRPEAPLRSIPRWPNATIEGVATPHPVAWTWMTGRTPQTSHLKAILYIFSPPWIIWARGSNRRWGGALGACGAPSKLLGFSFSAQRLGFIWVVDMDSTLRLKCRVYK